MFHSLKNRHDLDFWMKTPRFSLHLIMAPKQHPQQRERERHLAVRREGYNSLAAWMVLDPDKEALIFRKFDYLSARRTLHLQSQVLELEEQLQDLDAEASKNVESKKSLKEHETFEERSRSGISTDKQRMELLDEIHSKLTDYRTIDLSCAFNEAC